MSEHFHRCLNSPCRKSWKCHHATRDDCPRDDDFECLDCARRAVERSIAGRKPPETTVKVFSAAGGRRKKTFQKQAEALFDYQAESSPGDLSAGAATAFSPAQSDSKPPSDSSFSVSSLQRI